MSTLPLFGDAVEIRHVRVIFDASGREAVVIATRKERQIKHLHRCLPKHVVVA